MDLWTLFTSIRVRKKLKTTKRVNKRVNINDYTEKKSEQINRVYKCLIVLNNIQQTFSEQFFP